MTKKLTCYRCKKKFDGDPARGNLCEKCRNPDKSAITPLEREERGEKV